MNKLLKISHLIGLAVFLGSIPGHILLGGIGNSEADLPGFAVLITAKQLNVQYLTVPGLILTLLSGAALAIRRDINPMRARWLVAKLILVVLITLNGMLILGPLSQEMAVAARNAVQLGALPVEFAALEQKEAIFGAVNLVMVFLVISLAVAKPALCRAGGVKTLSEGAM